MFFCQLITGLSEKLYKTNENRTKKLTFPSVEGWVWHPNIYNRQMGRRSRGATVGARPLLNVTLWLSICLQIEAQHILIWAKAIYYLILPIINIPSPPLSITQ